MFSPLSVFVFSSLCFSAGGESAPDTAFVQEYHAFYPVVSDEDSNDIRGLAVDGGGGVYAATKGGAFYLEKGRKRWTPLMGEEDAGPVFDVLIDGDGAAWFAGWNGVYRVDGKVARKAPGVDGLFTVLYARDGEVCAMGPTGWWEKGAVKPLETAGSLRKAMVDASGHLWVATAMGLYRFAEGQRHLLQHDDEIMSAAVEDVAQAADGRVWVACLGGVSIFENGRQAAKLTAKDGLPSVYVQSVTQAPTGAMWFGTQHGVVRYDNGKWSVRHSRRWVRDDDVRRIVFDAEGTAWVATAKGVSAIKRRMMTLAEKARYFDEVCMARHVRAPWLVESCCLLIPGKLSSWKPRDDDNDGEYTGMYCMSESLRYAATNEPAARENAKKAFGALAFLQTVTNTPGFVARTVIPGTWKPLNDKNKDEEEQEWADRHAEDPRHKKMNIRWRPSEDGKWLWKGDTSSDEITGHFCGYLYYYDFAADDAEKERVRAHVRRVMDYIMDNGYALLDTDGKHTRWGVWAPEKLNDDPNWRGDRGLNSLEILSYLKTTYHITGDAKYQDAYLHLIREHHYAENARNAKSYGLAWRTHIDDELLSLALPGLLLCEKDPELLQIYRESLDHWYKGIEQDENPFFNYIYASLSGKGIDPHPDQSLFYLRDTPLDLVNWKVDNTKREDMRMVRSPEIEPLQTERLLPPSERGVVRWDKNPWMAMQGDEGLTEWAPTSWMVAYWMGRYYGFIQ